MSIVVMDRVHRSCSRTEVVTSAWEKRCTTRLRAAQPNYCCASCWLVYRLNTCVPDTSCMQALPPTQGPSGALRGSTSAVTGMTHRPGRPGRVPWVWLFGNESPGYRTAAATAAGRAMLALHDCHWGSKHTHLDCLGEQEPAHDTFG